MTRLLDVNVLLALAWPNQVMHGPARKWLKGERARGKLTIATCPITELGFIRVSMNVRGFAQDFSNGVAALRLLLNREEFNHEFWPDAIPIFSVASQARPNLGPAQLTDFYLLELAKHKGGRLVTFDQGIKDASVELIEAS